MDTDNLNVRSYTEEKILNPRPGNIGIMISTVLLILGVVFFIISSTQRQYALNALGGVCIFMLFLNNKGFITIEPNEAVVVTYYGKYIGTVKENGFFWINPFSSKEKISLKARNLDGAKIKVNDRDGSPIEIAVVVVWKISNTAKALFDVQNYTEFINVNSESAIRQLASTFPYDKNSDEEPSLRGNHPDVISRLLSELSDKTKEAGITIVDAKITHLAYSAEISNAMLKRQQAQATIDARHKIIQGACGIVNDSVNSLRNMGIEMSDRETARLVTNLLVVLSSESNSNNVVNTGSS